MIGRLKHFCVCVISVCIPKILLGERDSSLLQSVFALYLLPLLPEYPCLSARATRSHPSVLLSLIHLLKEVDQAVFCLPANQAGKPARSLPIHSAQFVIICYSEAHTFLEPIEFKLRNSKLFRFTNVAPCS